MLIAFCQADAELNVLVYFDLETTYSTNTIKIAQIACIGPDKLLIIHIFCQPVVFPLILRQ